MRDVDGLVHAFDCLLTTACLWIGLLLFAYMGGDMIGFWGALVAVLAAASMWSHVLRLCEMRAVGHWVWHDVCFCTRATSLSRAPRYYFFSWC